MHMKSNYTVVALLVIGLAYYSTGSYAQQPSRVTGEIDSRSLVTLRGSADPHAAAQFDLGPVDPSTRLTGVTIHFKLGPEGKTELDALVAAQQTPGSPQYHKWLTPDEYASRFGLNDHDLEAVQAWLEQQGFSIDRVAQSRTSISFSGSAGQIKSAFHTELHRYQIGGEKHLANASDIAIPMALSGVIGWIGNLSDFRPQPYVRFNSLAVTAGPNFTSGQSGEHYLTPKDAATIYDVNAVYKSGYSGTGQSIAIVGQSKVDLSDVENFQNAAGLNVKDPTLVLVPNSGSAAYSPRDHGESDLDLEYSGGMAQGATIYLVYVGNNSSYSVWDSIEYAVDTDIAPIISISYGACETALSSSFYSGMESILEQGASQGQSIVVASGDSGSTSCYGNASLTVKQQQALAVSYPASSAYVTAIGGTEFSAADVSSSNTTYWEASTSGSDLVNSAISYIPEVTWNDSSSSGLSAGGGGISALTARPAWQAGVTGISSGSYRLLPDISFSSSPYNAGYLYCSSDPTTGIDGSCSHGFRDTNNKYLTIAGGTSFAAPVFAGMLALINERENSTGQGLINQTLYTLAADSNTYATAFHDITSGGNQCPSGAAYCSSQGSSQYSAGTGYDEATGLGSVDLSSLLAAWPSSSSASLQATKTSLSPSGSNLISGGTQSVTITVAAQSSSVSSTPTGTLTVDVDGKLQTSSLSLSNGSATYSFSSSAAGEHVITAVYSGDSSFASSSGTSTITIVTNSGSGGSGSSTVTVTPSGGYTGTVDMSVSSTSSYLQNYACYQLSNASITGTSAASETLTIYLGSSNCSGSSVRIFQGAATRKSGPTSVPNKKLASFGLAGLLLAGIIGTRSRRIRFGLSCLALVLGASFVSGCSGSGKVRSFSISNSPSSLTISAGNSGIPTGTYTLTIKGQDSADTSLSSSASLALTVN